MYNQDIIGPSRPILAARQQERASFKIEDRSRFKRSPEPEQPELPKKTDDMFVPKSLPENNNLPKVTIASLATNKIASSYKPINLRRPVSTDTNRRYVPNPLYLLVESGDATASNSGFIQDATKLINVQTALLVLAVMVFGGGIVASITMLF